MSRSEGSQFPDRLDAVMSTRGIDIKGESINGGKEVL
jgi:hypothetical protein